LYPDTHARILQGHILLLELQKYFGYFILSLRIKSRMMRWAGHVARMGEKRNSYRILVGKPEGKRPLGRV
jgi:hypothetical protein